MSVGLFWEKFRWVSPNHTRGADSANGVLTELVFMANGVKFYSIPNGVLTESIHCTIFFIIILILSGNIPCPTFPITKCCQRWEFDLSDYLKSLTIISCKIILMIINLPPTHCCAWSQWDCNCWFAGGCWRRLITDNYSDVCVVSQDIRDITTYMNILHFNCIYAI